MAANAAGSARAGTSLPNTLPQTLLDSLEKRLDLLSRTLNEAEIADKSIDIVREIKELHAILRSLRELAAPAEQSARRLVVVWGGSAGQSGRSASAAGPGTLSTARKAAAKPVNLTNE